MALVAGGVALITLASIGDLPVVIVIIAAVSSLGGAVLGIWALVSWRRSERALRLSEPLPPPAALPWVVAGVVAVGLFLAGFAAFRAIEAVQ